MYKVKCWIHVLIFLALFGVDSSAEESCSAIVIPEKTVVKDGSSRYVAWMSFNGSTLPEVDGNTVFVFNDLSGKNKLQMKVGSSTSAFTKFSCDKKKLNIYEFNSFQFSFKAIDESRAKRLLDSRKRIYERVQYYHECGRDYVKYAEKSLPRGAALAAVYAGLSRGGQTDTLVAAQPVPRVTSPSVTAATERLLAARVARAKAAASTPPAVSVSKPPSPRPPVKAKAEVNRYAVAVIVGNRNYSNHNRDVPNVDYAHNDADQIYRYVIETLGYRDGNVILLKDATQADLVGTFGSAGNAQGKLYDWVRAGKSDVFVYYSGHGAPGISNGQGYLLPVDSNPNKVELNGFPLKTLYANLSKIPAKSMTIVMDACFSGGSSGGSVVMNASSIALKRVESKQEIPSAAIFTATGLSEVASWDTEQQMGLFTRHFLEGMRGKADDKNFFGNGDGKVTVGELKEYLQEEVTYRARRMYGRNQNPQVSGADSKVLTEVR